MKEKVRTIPIEEFFASIGGFEPSKVLGNVVTSDNEDDDTTPFEAKEDVVTEAQGKTCYVDSLTPPFFYNKVRAQGIQSILGRLAYAYDKIVNGESFQDDGYHYFYLNLDSEMLLDTLNAVIKQAMRLASSDKAMEIIRKRGIKDDVSDWDSFIGNIVTELTMDKYAVKCDCNSYNYEESGLYRPLSNEIRDMLELER